jgi:hypothetical protein
VKLATLALIRNSTLSVTKLGSSIGRGPGFLQGDEPKVLAQPGKVQVPETIFGECFDHRVDLWRAGYMVSGSMRTAGGLNVNIVNADLCVHI